MNGQMSAFVAPDEYRSRIEQLLDDEQRLSLAIAFWGKGAVELVSSRPGKDIRILCNLMSGGTNPYVIQELRGLARESDGRIQIHQCNQLHAKVVVGGYQALIGSANVSTNGLGLGHQGVAHWLEAGVLTSDESVVSSARKWFDELWESDAASVIKDEDIAAAIKIWNLNRRGRQLPSNPEDQFDLSHFSAVDLEDMPAYALLYRDEASEEADKVAEDFETEQSESAHSLTWWAFEGWQANLSAEADVDNLSICYPRDGSPLTIDGVCRMVGQRREVVDANKSKKASHVDMALTKEQLLNRPFGESGIQRMSEQLAPFGSAIWKAAIGNRYVRRIHIAELARVLQEQSAR